MSIPDFFHHWELHSLFFFSFCCFWLCICGEGCFGFSPRLFFQNHSRFVILAYLFVSFSVFHFNIPRFFFMSPTFELTLSFCFSGVLFLAPLSILRSCFVPSNQFPAIPFSNAPCFHFWSFRSSMLPLFTLFFLQAWRFLLVFFCWFLFGLLLTVVVTILSRWGFSSELHFLSFFWWSDSGDG